jgi:hypothetical protein
MSDDYLMAMGLLLGDRPSRDDVQHAVSLLERASAAGNGEASERCALFEAMGMMRPQDWTRAISLLELAAQQGSRSAQEQLLLLRDPSADPRIPDPVPADLWNDISKAISIAQRTEAGEKRLLSDDPHIWLIRSFATPPECRWLIGLARERVSPATVFDQATGAQTHHAARDNKFFSLRLGEMNVFSEVIRNRISSATRLPVPLFEPAQLLHYSVGEQFRPHYDFLDPANPAYHTELANFGQRIGTFLIYLNSGYEGGETSFPEIGLNFRANEGDALFFANVTRGGHPDPKTRHAGLPPTSGEKWVFSQWIRGQLPKA